MGSRGHRPPKVTAAPMVLKPRERVGGPVAARQPVLASSVIAS